QAVSVVYKTPPPPRPEIALISPATATAQVVEPELDLVFEVKSTKPLKRVEVTQDQRVLFQLKDPEKLAPARSGVYRIAAGKLGLSSGINQIQLEAVNDGGPKTADLVVGVTSKPVELFLTQIRTEGPKSEIISPAESEGSKIFDKVPDGHVILEG